MSCGWLASANLRNAEGVQIHIVALDLEHNDPSGLEYSSFMHHSSCPDGTLYAPVHPRLFVSSSIIELFFNEYIPHRFMPFPYSSARLSPLLVPPFHLPRYPRYVPYSPVHISFRAYSRSHDITTIQPTISSYHHHKFQNAASYICPSQSNFSYCFIFISLNPPIAAGSPAFVFASCLSPF